jgi:hypothetical protein
MKRKMSEDAKARKMAYDLQYSQAHIVKRVIDFNKASKDDMEILDHLDTKPNKARYVKGLIRDDMDKGGK